MKQVKVEWTEGTKIGGYFEWTVFDKDGNIKTSGESENLVVTAGIGAITGLMLSDVGGTAFDYLEVGTDATAAAANQTALLAAITDSGLARAAGTGTQTTTTVTNDTAQITYTWSSITATKAIKEVGVFNAASEGTMLARSVINVTVNSGDSLQLTYKTKLAAS